MKIINNGLSNLLMHFFDICLKPSLLCLKQVAYTESIDNCLGVTIRIVISQMTDGNQVH